MYASNDSPDPPSLNETRRLTTSASARELTENYDNDHTTSPLNRMNSKSYNESNVNTNINKKCSKRQFTFNLLLTNARSLAPKMNSLLEYIDECDVAAAIVSESWLKPGPDLKQEVLNLKNEENVDLFHFSRKLSKKGRPAGGGVAIIANRSFCLLKELKITRGKSEIVCTVGKINGCSRKLVIIGIYISPRCRAPQVHDALERVSNVIRQVKDMFPDPFIVLGGDFNKARIEEAIDEFPDITVVNAPATRGSAKLDLVATNFEEDIDTTTLCPPPPPWPVA